MNTETIDALKQIYTHLSFIHNKFLTTQFYLEEMNQADSAMKWLTSFANELAEKLSKSEVVEAKTVEVESPQTDVVENV